MRSKLRACAHGATKSDGGICICRNAPKTAGGTDEVITFAAPRPAAHNAMASRIRSQWVGSWRAGVIGFAVPIRHKFPKIARHIQGAVRATAFWIIISRCRIANLIVVVQEVYGRRIVSPRVHALIHAARGFFLLGFGRQPTVCPLTIGLSVIP